MTLKKTLVISALAVSAAAATVYIVGGDRETKEEKKVCQAVLKAAKAIEDIEFPEGLGKGDVIETIDVSGMDAAAFKKKIETFPAKSVHLWMPGEHLWVLAGRSGESRVEMAAVMKKFAMSSDPERPSVPEAFASYAGTKNDFMPAFESKLEGNVLPQWFMTKDIPRTDWLSYSEVDDDIAQLTRAALRSMQTVRRLVLQGNIIAASSKDEKTMDDAIDCWARAAKRNPNDPILVERLEKLTGNAEVFFRLGKFNQALKCYETIVVIKPSDPTGIYNLGICLQRLGRDELAVKVFERAKKLAEAAARKTATAEKGSDKGSAPPQTKRQGR